MSGVLRGIWIPGFIANEAFYPYPREPVGYKHEEQVQPLSQEREHSMFFSKRKHKWTLRFLTAAVVAAVVKLIRRAQYGESPSSTHRARDMARRQIDDQRNFGFEEAQRREARRRGEEPDDGTSQSPFLDL
jgi:hypothetical protein